MTAFETIIVERPEPRVARIVMNRPEARNAQNLQMTYDLNAAFDHAVQDDASRSSSSPAMVRISPPARSAARRQGYGGCRFSTDRNWGGFAEANAHGRFAREQEIYLQITRRWRNLAKRPSPKFHANASPAD